MTVGGSRSLDDLQQGNMVWSLVRQMGHHFITTRCSFIVSHPLIDVSSFMYDKEMTVFIYLFIFFSSEYLALRTAFQRQFIRLSYRFGIPQVEVQS